MKNKVIAKRDITRFVRSIPFGLYLGFVALLLVGVVVLSILLLTKYNPALEDSTKIQLIIGIVGSVLSFILCLNGIMGTIISIVKYLKKKEENNYEKASIFIKDFNDNILEDLAAISKVAYRVEAEAAFSKRFASSFANQETLVAEYEAHLANKKMAHKEILLFAISTVFYTSKDLVGNIQMIQFAETVINAKNTGSKPISSFVKTIGGLELFSMFKQRRIKVLNFFERLAVEYVNGSVAEELIDVQFNQILDDVSSMLYYYVYTNEGLDSYPYLNVMLQKMHID